MALSIESQQRLLCARFGVDYWELQPSAKVGIARNVKIAEVVHGLRHPPAGDTTGWYIWSGELEASADFFIPLHHVHLDEWRPDVRRFLAMPPGWRFLVARDYEDVWFDESLLHDAE